MFDILPPIDPIAGKEMQLSAGFDTGITRYINCSLRQYLCISWYAASLNVLATRYRSHAEFCRVHTDRVESFDHLTMITFVSSHHVLVAPLVRLETNENMCITDFRCCFAVGHMEVWDCLLIDSIYLSRPPCHLRLRACAASPDGVWCIDKVHPRVRAARQRITPTHLCWRVGNIPVCHSPGKGVTSIVIVILCTKAEALSRPV